MDNSTKRLVFDLTAWTVSLIAGMVLLAHEAMADSHLAPVQNERWKTECGSCHVAYPPQLLPAASWRRIMSGLDRHFGTDASLEPQAAAEIGTFLERHAGGDRRGAREAAPVRITETRWFVHEHDEVPAASRRSPEVKSPANCAACHTRAERGDFRERTLRLPR